MTMRAIRRVGKGQVAIQEAAIPALQDEFVLVKVKAVAINPTDWKTIDHGKSGVGAISGCDYVGIVEEVGSKVTKSFKKGDRIAGFVQGSNILQPENGAYADYLIAKGDVQGKVPDNLSDEEAATLGISVTTVAQGLYKTLELPWPNAPSKTPEPILIYGGSTATGVFAVQYAKLSGLTVIATASPHNFDYLKSLGVDAVYDYKSPTCAEDIKKFTENKLKLAWDCTGYGAKLCAAAMSDVEEGKYATIIPVKEEDIRETNPKVQGPFQTLAYYALGEKTMFGDKVLEPMLDEFEYAKRFWSVTDELLEQGKLKTIRPIVNRGGSGLEGVLVGLDELRADKVSGGKLVYTL